MVLHFCCVHTQFEQAKKDFDEERRQRENDAQAVAMFKKKSKQMEEDITQLHQKSNVLEQHIATLEVAVCDSGVYVIMSAIFSSASRQ